jgi:hypothetical protein
MHSITLLAAGAAVISQGLDEQAKFPYWQITNDWVSIRLVQRLPDQTRGYFQARGFSPKDADLVARQCVFQTIIKNEKAQNRGTGLVAYNLREWVVYSAGRQQGLKTREDWQKEWKARGASPAAQLAFEWSLLPTQQVYQPGDYNWGMSVYNLAPGSTFDLDVTWYQRGEKQVVRIRDIRCAPDERRDPEVP